MNNTDVFFKNHIEQINYIKNNFTKYTLANYYYPLIISYLEFLDEWDYYEELENEDIINFYFNNINSFNYRNIKSYINNTLVFDIVGSLEEGLESGYFDEYYEHLKGGIENYLVDDDRIAHLGKKLFDIHQDISINIKDMGQTYRSIIDVIDGMDNELFLILHYNFNNSNEDNNEEQFDSLGEKLNKKFGLNFQQSENLIRLLCVKAKEIHEVIESYVDEYYTENVKSIYNELKNSAHSADDIITELFKSRINKISNILYSKYNEDDEDSPLVHEVIEYVYDFVDGFLEADKEEKSDN